MKSLCFNVKPIVFTLDKQGGASFFFFYYSLLPCLPPTAHAKCQIGVNLTFPFTALFQYLKDLVHNY